MKQLRYFFAIIASALLMFACQEDFAGDYINDGTLKLRFEIPAPETVDITRGAVEETEAYNVIVYIFDSNGEIVDQQHDIKLTPTNENSYTRKYEVTLEGDDVINLAKGTYDIYAIANTESNSLWNGIAAFNEVDNINDFKALALTLNTIENTSKRMTLSGHATFSAAENTSLLVDIKLSRPYAKVTFNVKSGSVNPNFKFTPTSYSIYNIPSKSRMFDNTDLIALSETDFKNYEERAIPLSGSFEFIQLENIYDVANGPTKYTDREKRVEGSREFAYAPEYSTYVVIYGDGVETETTKDAQGNVISTKTTKISKTNYTIHLGDFSSSGSMGNYSVERNTHYTYNVTVNGVNMIEVEAKRENADYENGAEGYVIDMRDATQVYNLDAHYETVMLRFSKAMIVDPELITLSVSSPLMAEGDKNVTVNWKEHIEPMFNTTTGEFDQTQLAAFYNKYDAQWVEFMPVDGNTFAAYPGTTSDKLLDICSLMKELVNVGNGDETSLIANRDGYYYVVAFIDEFYYGDKDKDQDGNVDVDTRVQNANGLVNLSKFINKQEGREMKIMQNPQVSADGYSIYSQALCAFSQKSISTMFNLSSTDNIFGIEMYDETGLMSSNQTNKLEGSSMTDGWANMTSYITDTKWTAYVNAGGYSYEGQPNGNTLNVLKQQDAAYACMQRNRDLDGNGTIDDDEIHWYVPALDQYSAFWYGEEALPTYARLYQGLTTDVKSHEEHSKLNHYYTSTNSNRRLFFAIEGSSYNSYPYNSVSENNTRCIRNLRSVNGTPATATSKDGNYVYVNNFVETAYRTTTQNGQYPEHHEREILNKLPYAFKVATTDITDFKNVSTTYTIKAPNITSAVGRNGQTILTFADLVTDGTVGYYYNTKDETSTATRIYDVSNHQAAIGIELSENGSTERKTYTISNAAYQNSTLTLTLSAALPTGVTLYYATAPNGAKTRATGNNTQYTCGNNPSVYVWLSADGGLTFSDSYATVTTATTTVDQNVTISSVSRQTANNANYYRLTLSQNLPTGVTLWYATSLNGTKYQTTRNGNNNREYNCNASGSTYAATTYVWLSADGGQTFSNSYATVTTTTETKPTTTTQTVNFSSAARQGSGTNRYYTITLSNALPNGVTLWYCQGNNSTASAKEATKNSNTQYTLGSASSSYDPTYVWISGDGGNTFSQSISITGRNTLSSNRLSIDVTTETTTTTTSVTNGALKIGVPQSTTTVTGSSLSVNVPVEQTPIYLWAYDQGLMEFSNPTIIISSSIQVGADKTITQTGVADWDEMRLLATTQDLCANYSEGSDPSGAPEWRVPNQRELTVMNLYAVDFKLVGTKNHAYFSCTKYSNAVNASQTLASGGRNRRYAYVIENPSSGNSTYGGGVVALDTRATSFHIRCVRDLAADEGPNTNGSTDGDTEDGGNG